MAFCNSCGASLVPGTAFCSKCGAAILASSPDPGISPPAAAGVPTPVTVAPPPPAGGGALKAILIVVGVVVLVGFLAAASAGFFFWRIAHRSHIRQNGDDVRVETPFGSVQTTKDPQQAARDLGVDIYPGADILKDGSASATFGGVHTTSLGLETSDSVEKVCSFYQPKFPNAMVTTNQSNQCTIVSNDKHNMITVNATPEGDKTRIMISKVSRSGTSNSGMSDSGSSNPPSN